MGAPRIDNAEALLELDAEHGGFGAYLRSHGSFEATVADLKRQFRFIGDSGAYHFLWSVDERTPPYEAWPAARERGKSRTRRHDAGSSRREARSAS